MNSQLCFALSPSPFVSGRTSNISTCRRTRRPHIAIRRLRATAAETDPERPANIADAPTSEPESAETPVAPPATPSVEEDEFFETEVPGKIQLNELEIAAQRTALEKMARELRNKRLEEEREAAKLFGWVPYAEKLNGRLAMFFIVTGLLTEYWTGYTIPEQVDLMLRTLGII